MDKDRVLKATGVFTPFNHKNFFTVDLNCTTVHHRRGVEDLELGKIGLEFGELVELDKQLVLSKKISRIKAFNWLVVPEKCDWDFSCVNFEMAEPFFVQFDQVLNVKCTHL